MDNRGRKKTFNKSEVSKIKLPSVGAWLTNAGKSIGMATMDIIEDVLPATSELAGTVGEYGQTIKDLFKQVRNAKPSEGGMVSKYIDIGKEAINNTKADLKSGKLYHSMNDVYNEMNGDEFGDIDFGDDFDDDFSDDDYDAEFESEDGSTTVRTKHADENGVDVNNVQVNVDIDKTNKIASSVQSQTKIATEVGNTQIKAIDKLSSSNLTVMSNMSQLLSGYLGSIDSNVTTMVDVVSTMSQHSSVALRYYEDSMTQFKTISEAATIIKDTLVNGNAAGPANAPKEYQDVLDIFNSNGTLDLSAYMNLVKKQFGSAIDSNIFTSQIKFMLSDPDQIRAMIAHPLSNMVSGLVKGLMKKTLTEAASQFDNTLSEFATAALTNIAGIGGDGGFLPGLDIIGKTFGINNKLKENVDKSNYRTGKVDWTGQDKKTLNEVIPFYLRKIYATLSGSREIAFDYTRGIFDTVENMTKDKERQNRKDLIGGLSSDVTSGFKEFLNNNVAFTNSKSMQVAVDAMDNMLEKLVRGTYVIRKDENDSFRKSIKEISGVTDTALLDLMSAYIDNRSNADNMYLFGRGRQEARASMSKKRNQEESGELLTNTMYYKDGTTHDTHLNTDKNGTVTSIKRGSTPFIDVDKYGKSPVNYLRQISTTLAKGIVVFPTTGVGGVGSGSGSGANEVISAKAEYEKKKRLHETAQRQLANNEQVTSFSLGDNYEFLKEAEKKAREEFIEAEKIYKKVLEHAVSGVEYKPTKNGIAVSTSEGRKVLEAYSKQKRDFEERQDKLRQRNYGTDYTPEEMVNRSKKGTKIVVDLRDSDASNYAQLSASAKDFIASQNEEDEKPSWFTKLTGLKEDKAITKIVNKFTQYLQKPSDVLTDFFKKADTILFDIVFGKGVGPGTSMVKQVADSIKLQFTKVSTWLNDNILEPLKENLFGDKGIITQLKETTIGQAISDKFDKIKNYFLGEKVLMEDGTYERQGGVFSNLANEFRSTGKDLWDTARTTVADSIDSIHNFIKPEQPAKKDELHSNVPIEELAKIVNNNGKASLKMGKSKVSIVSDHVDKNVRKHADMVRLYKNKLDELEASGVSPYSKRYRDIADLHNKEVASRIRAEDRYAAMSDDKKARLKKIRQKELEKEAKKNRTNSSNKVKISTRVNTNNDGPTPVTNPTGDEDRHAKGISKIPRTGAYILTKGETVINNGDIPGSQKAEAQYVAEVKQKQTAGERLKNAVDSFTSDLTARFKQRGKEFTDSMFGGESGAERKKALNAVTLDLRGKGANIGANVGFGILTSIFMPWGIVGGALVGLGRGLIKNSENVKKLLFGDVDENGERQGNIVSKEIIGILDENKTGVKIGAIAGLASVVGILPAVWGGTLTYMAAGLATSMAAKSEFIQKWLYGEMDEDGNRVGGGFADKVKSAFGKDYKKLGLDIGLGAGLGIIGSFFLPTGLIGGALIGSATSIALNTEKFKSFFFGDIDPDTGKREGGLMGKFSNAVIKPVVDFVKYGQDKLLGWFEQKILIPIQTSMAAITEFIFTKVENTVSSIVDIFKGVGSYIGKKIASTAERFIKPLFDPFINGIKKVFGYAFKMIGNTIAMPFTVLGQLGIMADKSNRHTRDKNYNRDTIVNALTFSKKKRAKKGLDEDISFSDRIKAFSDFFNREKRKEAVTPDYSEHGETLKDTIKEAREESKAWIEYKSYMRKHGLKDKMVSRREFDNGNNPEGKVYSKWKTGKSHIGKAVDEAIKTANIESGQTVVNADKVVVNGSGKRTAKEAFGKDYDKYVENHKKKHPDEPIPLSEEEFYKKKIQRNKEREAAIGREEEKYKSTSKKGKKKNKLPSFNVKGDIPNDAKINTNASKVVGKTIKKSKLNPNNIDVNGNIPNHADGIENNSTPHLAVINSGETVIPSGDPDAKKKEHKFIENLKKRKKEREEERMRDSSGFINQFILRFKTHQAERQGRQKEADELRKAQEAGSYETRAKLAREAEEKKEQKAFRDKILETVQGIKDKTQEHIDQFKAIFGAKGKIAVALLAALPVIKQIWDTIKNIFGKGDSVGDFADNVPEAVKKSYNETLGNTFNRMHESWVDAGGRKAAINRGKDQLKDFAHIFNFKSDEPFLERLAGYFFPKDENGNNTVDHLTRVKLKALGYGAKGIYQENVADKADEYLKQLKENKYAVKEGGQVAGFNDTVAGRAADYDYRTRAYVAQRREAKKDYKNKLKNVKDAQANLDDVTLYHDYKVKTVEDGTEISKKYSEKLAKSKDELNKAREVLDAKRKNINIDVGVTNHEIDVERYSKQLDIYKKAVEDSEQVKHLQDLISKEQSKLTKAQEIISTKNIDMNKTGIATHRKNIRKYEAQLNSIPEYKKFKQYEELTNKSKDKLAKAKKLLETNSNELVNKYGEKTIKGTSESTVKLMDTDVKSYEKKLAESNEKVAKAKAMLDEEDKAKELLEKAQKELAESEANYKGVTKQKGHTIYDKLDNLANWGDKYKETFTSEEFIPDRVKKRQQKKINRYQKFKEEAADNPARQKYYDELIAKTKEKMSKSVKTETVETKGFLSSKTNKLFTSLSEGSTKFGEKASSGISKAANLIDSNPLTTLGYNIKDAGKSLKETVPEMIKYNGVTEAVRNKVDKVKQIPSNIKDIAELTAESLKSIASSTKNHISHITNVVKDGITSFTNASTTIAKAFKADVKDISNALGNTRFGKYVSSSKAAQTVEGIANGVKSGTHAIASGAKSTVQGAKNGIKYGTQGAMNGVKGAAKNATNEISNFVTSNTSKVTSFISDITGKLGSKVGNVANAAKNGIKYGKQGLVTGIKNSTPAKVAGSVKNGVVSGIKNSNIAQSVGEVAAKVKGKVPGKIADKADGKSLGNKALEITKSVVKKAEHGTSGIMELVSRAVKTVSGMFSKLFKKSGKLATKAMGSIDSLLARVVKTVTKSAKFIKKSGEILAKVAKGAIPVINGVFMGFGIVSGYYDAANLFAVDKSAVDKTMQIISTVWGGLRNTSVGGVFDIINEFAAEIMGINVVREISTLAYNALAESEDAENLKDAQDKLKKEYNDAVNKEYQAFIKDEKNEDRFVRDKEGNIVKDENGENMVISFDEYRQMGKAESFEEFNNKKNKTLGTKIMDKFVAGKNIVKEGVTRAKNTLNEARKTSVTDVFSADHWKQDKYDENGNLKTEQQLAEERGKKIMSLPMDIMKGLLGDAVNMFDAVTRSISATIKSFGTNTKTAFSIKSAADVFKESWWTPPEAGDDKTKEGIETSSLNKIAFYINRVIMFIPAMVTGVVKGVGNSIANVVAKIRDSFSVISGAGGGFADAFGKIESASTVVSGEWWTPPKDEKGNPFSVGSRALFYASRVLAFIPGVFVGLFKDLKGVLDPVIKPIKDAIESVTGLDLDKEPKKVDELGVNKFLYYGAKALKFIPDAICAVAKKVSEAVGPIVDALKPVMGAIMNDITTAVETSGGTRILSSAYWSYNGRDDGGKDLGLGGLRKVIFYGVRILYMPIGLVVGLVKNVVKIVTPIIKGVVSIGAFLATNAFTDVIGLAKGGVSTIFTSDFWTPKGIEEGDSFSGLKKILYYASKILLLPHAVVVGLVSDVARNIGTIVSGVVSVGGFITGLLGDATFGALGKGVKQVFTGEYWKHGVADDDTFGGFKKVAFWAVRIVTLPASLVLGLVGDVARLIGNVVKGAISVGVYIAKTAIGGITDMSKEGITHLFTKDYWSHDVDSNDSFGGFKKVAFYIVRVMTLPHAIVMGLVGSVANKIRDAIDFMTTGAAAKDGSDTSNVKDWGDLSFSGGEKYTGIQKFIFIANRVVANISWIFHKVIDGIGGIFSAVGDAVSGAVEKIKNFFGFGGDGENEINAAGNGEVNFKIKHPKFTYSLAGGNGDNPEIVNGNPYYSQNDPKRKNKSYKLSNGGTSMVEETMGSRGCGPTAMAMVASKVKGHMGGSGNPYTPENMANLAEQNNYSTNAGTTPGYFTDIGTRLGMNVTPAMASSGNINAMVDSGQPVILQGQSSNPSSPYTESGHYVVAVGRDKSGKIIINDPRGKEHSKAYTIDEVSDGSGMAWAFSDGYSGNGTSRIGKAFNKMKFAIAGGNGKGKKLNWMSVVKAVKQAIADKKAGYSQGNTINITVNNKQYNVRTDCSGYVGACLAVYGVPNTGNAVTSSWLAKTNNSTMSKNGFTHFNWSGWDNLQEGDILAVSGHTEIFAYNKNGSHYVYNCGGTNSCNNPNPTRTGHSSYTDVWRPNELGGASVSSSTSASSSGEEKVGFISALTKMAEAVTKPYQELLYGKSSDSSDNSSSDSNSSSSSDTSNINSGSSTNLKGGTTEKKVWNYFRGKGFSEAATAGIMGNIYQESKFNPALIQSNGRGPAAGLFQWENYNKYKAGDMVGASRFGVMAERAKKKGISWKDLKHQLDFAYGDMSTKDIDLRLQGKIAPQNLSKAGATVTTYEDFKNTNNAAMATRQFEAAFERAGDIRMQTRIDAAKRYYNQYKGGNGDVKLAGGNGQSSIGYRPNSASYRTNDIDFGGFGFNDSMEPTTRYKTNSIELPSQKYMNDKVSRSEKLNNEIKQYNDTKLLEALSGISSGIQDSVTELRGTNEGIQKFNDKDFSQKQPVIITGNGNTTNNIIPESDKGRPKKAKEKRTPFIDDNYNVAKQIARGLVTI